MGGLSSPLWSSLSFRQTYWILTKAKPPKLLWIVEGTSLRYAMRDALLYSQLNPPRGGSIDSMSIFWLLDDQIEGWNINNLCRAGVADLVCSSHFDLQQTLQACNWIMSISLNYGEVKVWHYCCVCIKISFNYEIQWVAFQSHCLLST